MEGFLTLILLILGLILVLRLNLRLSMVLMMNEFFPIFSVRDRKCSVVKWICLVSLFPNTMDIEKNRQCTGREKF